MVENIINLLRGVVDNDYIIVGLLSILPLIEVRGAVPIGIAMGINPFLCILISSACGAISVIPNMIFVKPFINKLKETRLLRGFAVGFENEIGLKAEKINKKQFGKYFGVFSFVSLPLPLTGGYTGSTVAVFMNLNFWYSVVAIFFGNIVASSILTILSIYFREQIDIIILILTILFVFSLLVYIYKTIKRRIDRR